MKLVNIVSVTITPDEAQTYLVMYPYERQRPINFSYVKYYAEMMKKREWLPGSPIAIAYAPNGNGKKSGHLINGRHRLRHANFSKELSNGF